MNTDIKKERKTNIVYASFFLKIIAVFIDVLILYTPLIILDMVFGSESMLTLILYIMLWGIYTAYLLSTSLKGTIGKKVLGLEVVNMNMEQLTFKEAMYRYMLSLVSYIFVFPLFVMFFTEKKQTFHDYYLKIIVVDNYKTKISDVNKEVIHLRKYLMTIVITGIVVLGIPLSIYAYYFIGYANSLNKQHENSYKSIHHLVDYNDTVLDGYKQKLMKITKVFTEENNEYLLFKSKMQEEILLECVRERYKQLKDDKYFRNAKYFVKNSRNSQIYNNEKKIRTVQKNEKIYFESYSKFDFDLIESSMEQVKVDKGSNMCDTNNVYQAFLLIYLSRQHYDKDDIPSNVWLRQLVENEVEVWNSFLINDKARNNE